VHVETNVLNISIAKGFGMYFFALNPKKEIDVVVIHWSSSHGFAGTAHLRLLSF